MELSRSILKDFAKTVSEPEKTDKKLFARGTVTVSGNKKYVKIDGSEYLTPIFEVVDAQDGDRVLVSIENHKATIVGNFTYPPSARTANEALAKSETAENTANEAINKVQADAEKITAAQQAAQEASAKAESAESLATEASNKASEAKTSAEEAVTKATEAKTFADNALTNVAAANTEISNIKSDITAVTTDVSAIRSEVKSQIDTLTETMSTDYAKKTDVTTVEGTLREEITKSASDLTTTISEIYVAKSELVTIQENLQTQITQNSEAITSSATKITKLETDTTNAQKAIDDAQSTADSALAAAGEAQTAASNAQTAADEAKAKADAADAELQTAKTNLATAEANLAAVTNRVDATEEEIDAAQAAVTEAQTAVNKAQADATSAKTAASNAQTAANNAAQKATEAKNAADAAQEDVDKLTSRVTTAETNITQNADSITSVANRTTAVENKFGEYSTTEQMNSAIEQKADSITSIVSATYATQDSLTTVSSKVDQTATKISWVVESGTSSTDFTITDRMATLTADYINLNGLVTFNGLNSDTRNKINSGKSAADTVDSWSHSSDTTLIDGGKIYTGTITADKLKVTDLSAVCATIGGFTINSNSLSAAENEPAEIEIYFKTDVENTFGYLCLGNKYSSGAGLYISGYDSANGRYVSTSIGNIGGGAIEICGNRESLIISYDGIHRSSDGDTTFYISSDSLSFIGEPSIGTNIHPTGDIYMGVVRSIYVHDGQPYAAGEEVRLIGYDGGIHIGDANAGSINFNGDLEFNSTSILVGTQEHPSSHHYMANNKYIYCNDSSGNATRVIGLTNHNNLVIGTTSGVNAVHFYNNILFHDSPDIGTDSNPSGSHVLANGKYVFGLNTSGQQLRLVGLSVNDNIVIGYYTNRHNNIYMYTGYQGMFNIYTSNKAGTDSTNILSLYYSSNSSSYALKIPCVYSLTTSEGSNVRVTSNGVIRRYLSSSKRYKENISEKLSDNLDPNRLYNLPVVEFIYKDGHISTTDRRYGQKFIGFIAEDVDDIYPLAANYNEDGLVEDWNMNIIVPGMLRLIQDQNKVDIELSSRLDASDAKIETLKNQLSDAMIKIASLEKEIDILKAA